jgi:outer membrane protein assembly factor BamB
VPFEAHEPMGAWAADETTLYVCRERDVVRALDAATGAARWTAATNAFHLVARDGVLVLSNDELLAALDTTTGRPVWELPRGRSAISVGNGTVVAVVQEGVPADPLGVPMKVIGLDAATGARLWTSEQYDFVGTLIAVAGPGAAYYCQDQRLVAREIRTGAVRWIAPVVGMNATVLGATEDFVVVRDSGLVVIDAATGRRCWEGNWQVTSVAFVGGLLVAQTIAVFRRNSLSVVHGLDPASGTLVWTVPPSGEPASPAVVTDERVYLSLPDGRTCAYASATGELLWSHDGGTPIAARGRDVYLLTGGEVQALAGP